MHVAKAISSIFYTTYRDAPHHALEFGCLAWPTDSGPARWGPLKYFQHFHAVITVGLRTR